MGLLTPDIIVAHVRNVTPELLQKHGIQSIISDLDNTLVPWRSESIEDEITQWLLMLHDAGIGVCIASNTRHLTRLDRMAAQMGILHVPGNASKPGRSGLRKALSLLNAAPSETAMVGDQLFTDILAGNRLGLTTILVNPLTPHEFIGTKLISRTAERFVLRGPRQRAS